MRYLPWIVTNYESVEDLQTLSRMVITISSIPLPMILFTVLGGCLVLRRYQ